ncbi:uncharacterized protein OCT59_024922 [Rhizophagus irregularis]|uniref:Uncharacterized protein n=1 Tax=Rhizophagus irregularis (strain DAOM 197198w) TaxID=1432141 RepID=A0A015KQW3_RHIIW|nr:hypothetical protein RirG_091340 [Rhizophagus irregularis DAOM 197198w]UZO04545.1 hypothetical protein OCT59_024922 [Rhizophagus irregularis]GBC19714.2 hypothetical protein RIR_jg41965.t1 [Rhizophagus irregularis DAOM 181602=DAOM 197198]
MSEVIFKIPDKLEPPEEELELVEAEAESSELPNSGSLVSDSLDTLSDNCIMLGQIILKNFNRSFIQRVNNYNKELSL